MLLFFIGFFGFCFVFFYYIGVMCENLLKIYIFILFDKILVFSTHLIKFRHEKI